MGKLRTIGSLGNLSGKTVLLRIDADVDLDGPKIIDDTRLESSVETIKLLLEKGAEINIVGHLGRPEGVNPKSEIRNPKFTLGPIAKWFHENIKNQISNIKNIKIGEFPGWQVAEKVNVLENIRFYREEEENDPGFARELSLLGDIYVNDAFAVCHREHASIVGVTKFIPSYAGLHLEKEIKVLGKILENPHPGQRPSGPAAKRPLAVLIGGAKIETKLPLVSKMHHVADYVLVGGEIAEQTRVLIKVQHEKINPPAGGHKSVVLVSESNRDGTDITPKSVENFEQILGLALTIVWNGPVGVIGGSVDTEKGTKALAEFIVQTKAYKVVGGGDTLAYLRRLNLLDKFDFVSTGGGAMLEFLSGHKLPGIKALEK